MQTLHIPDVVEDDGTAVRVICGEFWGTRGPVDEPVAWYGPIVMHTKQQLQQAVSELRAGTFIK